MALIWRAVTGFYPIWVLFFVFHSSTVLAGLPSTTGLVFTNVSYLEHNITVPLDWTAPAGPQITVVARVHNPHATDKPFIFFVGGGPTAESINAYSSIAQGYGYHRHLSELSKSYRIVTFDQRGFGRSTPLDRHNPTMDPVLIHKLFTAPSIAQDLAQIINVIAGPNTPFYLAGHSFGGEPIAHLLVQNQAPRPRGVLFLSAAPSIVDTTSLFHERMRTQIALNKKIQEKSPALFEKIINARVFIARELGNLDDSLVLTSGLDVHFPNLPNWGYLNALLDKILAVKPGNRVALERVLHSELPFFDLMAYVLDWSFQYRVSQKDLVNNLPEDITTQIKPWMLLEHRAIMSAKRQSLSSKLDQDFMSVCDEKLCGATVPLDIAQLTEALRNIPTLVLLAADDPMIPLGQMQKAFTAISTSNIHHIETIDGPSADHSASISAEALTWAMEKMESLEALRCANALSAK